MTMKRLVPLKQAIDEYIVDGHEPDDLFVDPDDICTLSDENDDDELANDNSMSNPDDEE